MKVPGEASFSFFFFFFLSGHLDLSDYVAYWYLPPFPSIVGKPRYYYKEYCHFEAQNFFF